MCARSKLSVTRQSIQQFCFELTDTFARWVVTTRKIIFHRDVFIAIPEWQVDPDNHDLRGATLLWQRWLSLQWRPCIIHFTSQETLHVPVSCLSCCILNWSGGLNSFTHKGSGGNEKLLPLRCPTVGIVSIIRWTTTQLPPTNIITMVLRLPPLRCRFNESPQSNAWAAIRRGRPRALRRGFI